ncbi:acyltransferase family protein [Ochrobactrum sp. A-1]|uniref:acyltransferase family protein n=1 Tax=Ochrobactrum sp. A-1 TaxID=2920940 RepID=UPI0018A951FE|nr:MULTISPECIES: acyltransferase family protein [unclassified Ochrobactrum]MCH4538655.1 acyltransferase family protein [Ochrobactrum sp. A-1]
MKSTEFATTLRGYAAICVLISHYFGVYWDKQSAVSELTRAPVIDGLSMPTYLLWLHPHRFFDWGPLGMALFFLVSGFVIPYSLEKASRLQFIVGRLFRIVPLYAAGFSVTLASVRGGSGNLHSSDKWNFCLSLA